MLHSKYVMYMGIIVPDTYYVLYFETPTYHITILSTRKTIFMAGKEDSPNSRRCCNWAWMVTTGEGWVKLIETVTTFLAAVLTLSYEFYRYRTGYKYQIGIATCAFVFLVLYIIFRSLRCFEKVPPMLGMIGYFLLSVTLFVGSGIVYHDGNIYMKGEVMIGSGICGFIAASLFFFEAIYYLFVFVSRRSPPRHDYGETLTREKHGPAAV